MRFIKYSKSLGYFIHLNWRLQNTLNKDNPRYLLHCCSVTKVGNRYKWIGEAIQPHQTHITVTDETASGEITKLYIPIYKQADWSELGQPYFLINGEYSLCPVTSKSATS